MLISFRKQLVWGLALFFLIFFLANVVFNFGSKSINRRVVSKMATVLGSVEPTGKKENIKLAFVGDIMLDRGVKNSVYKNFDGNYEKLFFKIGDQLKSYDILFANLEGPVSDKGVDIGGAYSFRMEPEVISVLKDVGFEVLSVANNHIFNWGKDAFVDTLQSLSRVGLTYVGGGLSGLEAYKGETININGIKITFLAFSEFGAGGVGKNFPGSGIALMSEKEIRENVSLARKDADLVVVSYHFGDEYMDTPNTYQRKYAELTIDSGADLVIGHHPHVAQTLEQYKNAHILYSLGNFIFDQYFSDETMQGGLLEVEVNLRTKQIEKANLKRVFLNKMFQIEKISD